MILRYYCCTVLYYTVLGGIPACEADWVMPRASYWSKHRHIIVSTWGHKRDSIQVVRLPMIIAFQRKKRWTKSSSSNGWPSSGESTWPIHKVIPMAINWHFATAPCSRGHVTTSTSELDYLEAPTALLRHIWRLRCRAFDKYVGRERATKQQWYFTSKEIVAAEVSTDQRISKLSSGIT